MKTLKITPPEGFEIDKEKSTFEEIVFKPMKKQLPQSWEELGKINGYWVDICSEICEDEVFECVETHKNIFATEEQAKASIALAQLSQLREVYRNGWERSFPNYTIDQEMGKIVPTRHEYRDVFLSFQSEEVRDEFLENFRELIKEASPLLFG